ncbi:MAG: hypothetical protein Q7U16_16155 [Agitococcus sp.]|nr:hypothetical protein [Agitococcus sp.]
MEVLNNYDVWLKLTEESLSSDEVTPIATLEYIKREYKDEPIFRVWPAYEDIYSELDKEFPFLVDFIYFQRAENKLDAYLSKENYMPLKGLLRWVINKITNWSRMSDPLLIEFSLVFYIINVLNKDLFVYYKVAVPSKDFLDQSTKILVAFKNEFSVRGLKSPPIWELEAVEKLKNGIDSQDWITITRVWPAFKSQINYNFSQIMMFKFLLAFDIDSLVLATNDYHDFVAYMGLMAHSSISLRQILELAKRTNSNIFLFSLFFSLESKVSESYVMPEYEYNLLADVFYELSHKHFFADWLKIFNDFPTRYSILSEGIGLYLAKYANESAMDAYLTSIELSKYSSAIDVFSRVFDCFKNNAPVQKRKLFWEKCYRKWLSWDFGSREEKFYLHKITLSDFNYSIILYYLECLSSDERVNIQQNLLQKIDGIFDGWYSSSSEQISHFYKQLSLLQPIAHAVQISLNPKTEPDMKGNRLYYSTAFNEDKRYEMAFNLSSQY